MDRKSDVLSKYDELKKELKEGMITEKGFDTKVKQLLENCCHSASAEKSKDAATVFEEMKNCLQGKSKNVKKKQYPLNDDAKTSFLRIKIIPMHWTSKTKTKPGRFTRLVLDEEPSRIFMKKEDGYELLVKKGKDLYWPNHSNEHYEFILCNPDGTRWKKQDFEIEHKTLGEIREVWKRNFYIGMKKKEISANVIPSFAVEACSSENADHFSNLPFELNLDSNSQLFENRVQIDHHASKKLKTLDIPDVSFTMKDMQFNFSEVEQEVSSRNEEPASKNLDPSVYYPRLPYVPKEHIKIDDTCVLGSGAYGTVYKGLYQGTVAAVKKIPCDDTISKEIKHEILVNMRLSHPNIVRLMAAAKTENAILLASEYIHGASLDKILHNENVATKLSEEHKLYIGLEIALAVEYIHSQNIIHQDIKPANVIIEQKNKKAFLTDWGMANIRDTVILKIGSQSYSQKIGPLGGTAMYMAPECLVHYQSPTVKTDVWSLGATLLEIFSNRKPWNIKNARELCIAMTSQIPPHAIACVNASIVPVISNCFSYIADNRPTPSDMIGQIKSVDGINLEKHYGYSW